MVFFVTIQDSVDEVRIHFFNINHFFSRYDNFELFNQKQTSCYLKYDWIIRSLWGCK